MRTKKFASLLFVAIYLLFSPPPVNAIENGIDSSGNGVVVPILIKYNSAGSTKGCSGALISSYVVATAGHCLLDVDGQGSSDIRVGPPGSEYIYDPNTWVVATQSWYSIDYQGNGINGTVGSSDIAFINLSKGFPTSNKIYFASESQLQVLKSSKAKLRVLGYGVTSDNGNESTKPNYFDGQYSNINPTDANASYVESINAGICKGDSGGPVLSITPTKIVIVGIVTGGAISKYCSQKQSDGKYYALFTIINHFSNLAMASQVSALEFTSTLSEKAIGELITKSNELTKQMEANQKLQSDISQAQTELESAKSDLAQLHKEVDSLNSIIQKLEAKLPKTITCIKGNSKKVISSINPKCPLGYKLN